MLLPQHIATFLAQQQVKNGQSILVAVSGGMDSMVLLHALHTLGQPLHVAHVNHSKRVESDEEAQFLEGWCTAKNIGISIVKLDTATMPAGANFQDWARAERYKFFKEQAQKQACPFIATAHHFNDKIETFFAHAMRGSGLKGLNSLHAKTGNIIRPLLETKYEDIQAYAREQHLEWREDASNASDAYQRNRIRHHLLPNLKLVNPNFESGFSQTFANLLEEQALIDAYVNRWKEEHVKIDNGNLAISIEAIRQAPAPGTILFHVLSKTEPAFNWQALAGCTYDAIGSYYLGKTHRALRDRQFLLVEPIPKQEQAAVPIHAATEAIISPIAITFVKVLRDAATNTIGGIAAEDLPFTKQDALLDFNKLDFPLILRNYEEGDRFRPLGMQGFKKVSDYLTDAKVPRTEKERTLVLTSGNEIVWVVGHRIDDRFKVGADTQMMYLARPQK